MKPRLSLRARIAQERKLARSDAFAEACRAIKWDLGETEIGDALWEWFQAGNTKRESGVTRNGAVVINSANRF